MLFHISVNEQIMAMPKQPISNSFIEKATAVTGMIAACLVVNATFLGSISHSAGMALKPMEDSEMSQVQGAGLAFSLDGFRLQSAPTSYLEQVGGLPDPSTSFNRGDLRWNGLAISGWAPSEPASDRTTWSGGCDNGLQNMGCPISEAPLSNYANHDNPFVLRVFDYTRVGLNGADWVGDVVDAGTGVSSGGVTRTVLEILGPSDSDIFRWSFWGEIQASTTLPDGSIDTVLGILANQNIILGKPASRVKPPSIYGSTDNPYEGAVVQLFENQSDNSLGLLSSNRLSGNYRFSVNQVAAGPDANGVPRFTSQEGLYFTNVNSYLPLGTLHYQSVILDDINPQSTGGIGNGNFVIELTRIPNDSNAYNDFYSVAGDLGYLRVGRSDRYYQTHGYVEWGDAFPTCTGPNCMSGNGVSQIRYASDATSFPVQTISVTSTNFPTATCRYMGNARECNQWSNGTAGGGSTSFGRSTIEQVTSNGISFVARAGGSWNVKNRPGYAFIDIRDTTGLNNLLRITNPFCFLCTTTRLNERSSAQGYNSQIAQADLTISAINLGTARIEGLLINHMKITSLGAGN